MMPFLRTVLSTSLLCAAIGASGPSLAQEHNPAPGTDHMGKAGTDHTGKAGTAKKGAGRGVKAGKAREMQNEMNRPCSPGDTSAHCMQGQGSGEGATDTSRAIPGPNEAPGAPDRTGGAGSAPAPIHNSRETGGGGSGPNGPTPDSQAPGAGK